MIRLEARRIGAAIALVVSSFAGIARGATIEGVVHLPERLAVVPLPNPRYQIKTAAPVGPPDPPAAVVYLDGDFPRQSSQVGTLAQHHYQFAPGLLAVRRGSVVRFPNLDDEYHSVFSYSKAKRFDLGRYHKDETPAELTFDQPGLVKLFCEIHEHMRGAILVLDTPYFTKTTPDGRYRLEGLPAGKYVLKAWIEEDTTWEHAVDLREGAAPLRVDFPES